MMNQAHDLVTKSKCRWGMRAVAGLLFCALVCAGAPAAPPAAPDPLAADFVAPPHEARPQAWWWWLRTTTTHEAITRDLEEMKAKGLSGCLLMDCGVATFSGKSWVKKTIIGETEIQYETTPEYRGGTLEQAPQGPQTWSPQWREMVRFAAKEAGRLGLDFGLFIGPAGCGAPWVTPEYAQQELVWTEKPVTGPAKIDEPLPRPAPKKIVPKRAVGEEVKDVSASFRDVAVLAVPAQGIIRRADVLDLSGKLDAAGRLRWDAPAGDWVILRFGQRPTGAQIMDLCYIDHLSAEAFDQHWAHTVKPLLNEMTPEERKGLKYVECDSWEAGTPTWTRTLPEEFQKRRGYAMTPYFPVLAGRTLESDEQSARFRRDYGLTIGDLIAENHYGRQRAVANADGIRSYAEAAGPHQMQADLLKCVGRCDIAMGEFWMPSPHRPTPPVRFLLRDAVTAAHIYGMNRVFAESFTSVGPDWEESPFLMKSTADQAFCDGLNWICFHTFSHHPSLTDVPGLTHSAGTHFDRTITWWEQSPPFVTYLARCSQMLRQGLFCADVAFYQGDGIRMTYEQGKPIPHMGWSDGLKNPPPTLGAGYDYDKCNTEVLLTRMSVKEGRIVLPDGMSYRVLALPEKTPLATEALRKLAELAEAGATMIGSPATGPAGLNEDAAEFQRLVKRLWGEPGAAASGEHRLGQGRVIWGRTIREVLKGDGVEPDFECSGVSSKGAIDWIHRKVGDTDIYYVTSRWQPVERVSCTFRSAGRQPELWDPVSGAIRDAAAFRQEGGRTTLPLELGPCGSVFVVFRKPASATAREGKNWLEFKPFRELTGPWNVAFDPKWGGPAEATFNGLTDWTQNPEAGIRYYSGKATYQKTFDMAQSAIGNPQSAIYLDLGDVRELAAVRLNGRDLGIAWTKPFRVNVTAALKDGANKLEIDVVNLWPNRLIGDEFLPAEKRFTRTNIRKFTRASALRPSGLLGPVRLMEAR